MVALSALAEARDEPVKIATNPPAVSVHELFEGGREVEVTRSQKGLADWPADSSREHAYSLRAEGYEPYRLELSWSPTGWRLPGGDPLSSRPVVALARPFRMEVRARPYIQQLGSLDPEHRRNWVSDDTVQVGQLTYYGLKPRASGEYCLPIREGENWRLLLVPFDPLFAAVPHEISYVQLMQPNPVVNASLPPRYGPFSYLWFDAALAVAVPLGLAAWLRRRAAVARRLRILAEIEAGGASIPEAELPELRGQHLHTDGGREIVILRSLGAGGMGAVFEGEGTDNGERVAVKMLYRSTSQSPGFQERFRREGDICLRLKHPGILKVLDRGEYQAREGAERFPFLVSELLTGQDLRRVLAAGRPEWRQAVTWMREILEALQTAHEEGIIHRDLKPENLMITSRNHVKIMDFGIARVLDKKSLTATASIIGTPHYMSPEHLSAKTVVPASDIFSLGVILYEMLAGHPPFEAEDLMVVLMRMMSEEPPPLETLRPDLPPELHLAVRRMLARDLAERYPSARAALEGLAPVSATSG